VLLRVISLKQQMLIQILLKKQLLCNKLYSHIIHFLAYPVEQLLAGDSSVLTSSACLHIAVKTVKETLTSFFALLVTVSPNSEPESS